MVQDPNSNKGLSLFPSKKNDNQINIVNNNCSNPIQNAEIPMAMNPNTVNTKHGQSKSGTKRNLSPTSSKSMQEQPKKRKTMIPKHNISKPSLVRDISISKNDNINKVSYNILQCKPVENSNNNLC